MAFAQIRRRMEAPAGWSLRALRCGHRQRDRWANWCGRSGGVARGEDGGSLIEFALVATVMMSFVLVVMQLCLAFYSFGMICETARETTRWASTRGTTCLTSAGTSCTASAANITTYAKALGLPNVGGGTMVITPSFPDFTPQPGNNPNCQQPITCRVVVNITYTVAITMPLVPKNAISLSTVSEMYYLQ